MLLGAKASSGRVTAALAWLFGKLILHRFEWFLLQYFLQHATQIMGYNLRVYPYQSSPFVPLDQTIRLNFAIDSSPSPLLLTKGCNSCRGSVAVWTYLEGTSPSDLRRCNCSLSSQQHRKKQQSPGNLPVQGCGLCCYQNVPKHSKT